MLLPMWLWWLLLLSFCVAICIAPRGLATSSIAAAGASSSTAGYCGVAAAAAAAGAAWLLRQRTEGNAQVPAEYLLPGAEGGRATGSKGQSVSKEAVSTSIPPDGEEEEGEPEVIYQEDNDDDEVSDEEWGSVSSDNEDENDDCRAEGGASCSSGKLWSREQFPEGTASRSQLGPCQLGGCARMGVPVQRQI